MCYPCSHEGRCCVNADPVAYNDEWKLIWQYLNKHDEEMQQAIDNFQKGLSCILYSKNAGRCLIHDERPLLCRSTPFNLKKQHNIYLSTLCLHNCNSFVMIPLAAKPADDVYTDIQIGEGQSRCYLNLNEYEELISFNAEHPKKKISEWFEELL